MDERREPALAFHSMRARICRRVKHVCHSQHCMSQASQMHHKNGMAQGFALFQNGAAARAAVDSLHNMV